MTHTGNLCSAFSPSKVHTHSSEHTLKHKRTHTLWTHTRSSGQAFMLQRPGSSCGFGALLKGTSVMVLKVYVNSLFMFYFNYIFFSTYIFLNKQNCCNKLK